MTPPAKPSSRIDSPLIHTRFRPPTLQPELVERRTLLGQLTPDKKSPGSLSLLTAPAGYGKSILMAQCYEQYCNAGWPVTWLTLDESDSDADGLYTYLSVCVRSLVASGEAGPIHAIDHGHLEGDGEHRLRQLLNSLNHISRHAAIFLDDFHLLHESSVTDIFKELFLNLPDTLSIVCASREPLPFSLSKLRSQQRLQEIKIDGLRFSRDEAHNLFMAANKLALHAEDLETIINKTEGWAAVMQLAAVSIKNSADHRTLVDNFAKSATPVFEFLYEEVFNGLPIESFDFLQSIAIADRVCPLLCIAITNNVELSAQLRALSGNGYLVQSLDGDGIWFRIHPLLRNFLLQKLEMESPGRKELLHQRAATWFEEQGLIAEAIQHAFSGGDEDHSAELLEEHGMQLINSGHLSLLLSLCRQLPKEQLYKSHEILLQLGWLEVLNGRVPQTRRILAEIKSKLLSLVDDNQEQQLKIAELEAAIYLYGEDYSAGGEHVKHWLPNVSEPFTRVWVSLLLLDSYILLSQFKYEKVLKNTRKILSLGAEDGIELSRSYAAAVQATIYYHRALLIQGLVGLEACTSDLSKRLGSSSQALIIVQSMLAANQYQQGDVVLAQQFFARTGDAHVHMVPAEHLLVLVPVRARLFQHQSDIRSAIDYLLRIKVLAEERGWTRLEACVLHELVRLYIDQGEIEQAKTAYEESFVGGGDQSEHKFKNSALASRYCELAHTRLLMAEAHLNEAVDNVAIQLEHALGENWMLRALENQVLLVRVYLLQGNNEAALKGLESAMQMDRENSCIQLFRDEGAEVLNLLAKLKDRLAKSANRTGSHSVWQQQIDRVLGPDDASDQSSVGDASGDDQLQMQHQHNEMVESLTKREYEVARQLSMGLSNKEISDHLHISVNTVKRHLQSSYAKLGVTRRTQALRRLKELGIFS